MQACRLQCRVQATCAVACVCQCAPFITYYPLGVQDGLGLATRVEKVELKRFRARTSSRLLPHRDPNGFRRLIVLLSENGVRLLCMRPAGPSIVKNRGDTSGAACQKGMRVAGGSGTKRADALVVLVQG